jgi:hypothetical protein
MWSYVERLLRGQWRGNEKVGWRGCEPLTANCFSIYGSLAVIRPKMNFRGRRGLYIFEVVRLLGIEVRWRCSRHGREVV